MAQAIGETARLEWERNNPIPDWHRAGVSESEWNAMDGSARWRALELASQDQGIHRTGDEALPFTWGPLLGNLAKYGVNEAQRQLLKNRLIKDRAGKPQKFYHGTSREFKGDLKPVPPHPSVVAESRSYLKNLKSPTLRDKIIQKNTEQPKAFLSTNPETANTYAFGSPYNKAVEGVNFFPKHSRVYPKYLTKEANLTNMGDELYGVATDPKMLMPPHAIAPKPLPNTAPLGAPALMDSMISREGE